MLCVYTFNRIGLRIARARGSRWAGATPEYSHTARANTTISAIYFVYFLPIESVVTSFGLLLTALPQFQLPITCPISSSPMTQAVGSQGYRLPSPVVLCI